MATYVYVLTEDYQYEGSSILAICDTMALAKAEGKKHARDPKWAGSRTQAQAWVGADRWLNITKHKVIT